MGLLLAASLVALRKKRNCGIIFPGKIPVPLPDTKRVAIRASLALLLSQRRRVRALHRNVAQLPRKWWVRPLLEGHDEHGAWSTLIPKMRQTDPERFYNFFRMTVPAFDNLLSLVGPHIQKKSYRKSICPGERLAITLRFLASGDSYESLSYLFLVSDKCISPMVLETCVVIWTVLQPLVFEELTEDFWLRSAAGFEVMWDLPHCIAAVDGKHVRIQAPPHSGSTCFNYKKFFSIILMAACDPKLKFVFVDVGASGRRGDGNVHHSSAFAKKLRRGRLNVPPPCQMEGMKGKLPFFVAGDGAFERQQYMLNPFKGTMLGPPERIFNYRFSRTRRCIEDGFGVLYRRFGLFKKPIEASQTTAKYASLACCALHNYHLMDKDSIPPKKSREARHKTEDPVKEQQVYERLKEEVKKARENENLEDVMECEEMREELLDYFIGDGAIPWQWKKAHVKPL